MKEITGDIWNHHAKGEWIVITTNGSVNKSGECVMGRGVALQAKKKFPPLARILGDAIKRGGNKVHVLQGFRLITFPVKHQWFEMADLELIKKSAEQLKDWHWFLFQGSKLSPEEQKIYLVRPGAGNGHRTWEEVKAVIEPILDDRFVIVQN
jgi:hypothetical protein